MNKLVIIPLFSLLLLAVDWYVFQGVKAATSALSPALQQGIFIFYWSITALTMIGLFLYHFAKPYLLGRYGRTFIMVGIFTNYLGKAFAVLFLLIDDLGRMMRWAWDQLLGSGEEAVPERSPLMAQAGLTVAAVPALAVSYGIISGAHDYRVRKKTIRLPRLPRAFDGIRIAQISDIHSGSFWNKTAVKGGVEMVNKEKADMVFFTGDLVNNRADEMQEYGEVFEKLTAPLGVYSVLGNHDYGDYVYWKSAQAKRQNLQDLIQIHKQMGWDILMNENRILKVDNEKLAILGIENWGAKARFPKYGKMELAHQGTEEAPVKLLLSHDPSHWDAQVRTEYPDIDLTLSGHTHGMQFGVEIPGFKWSPVQYVYDQWADLYQANGQSLYVNRGFGYLGFPGRIGMPPEITILELKCA